MNPHVIVFSHLLTTVDKGKKREKAAESDPFAISITITLWLSNGAFEPKKLHRGNEMTASGLMTFSPELNAVHMYVQVHSAGAIVVCKCLEMHCEEIAPSTKIFLSQNGAKITTSFYDSIRTAAAAQLLLLLTLLLHAFHITWLLLY